MLVKFCPPVFMSQTIRVWVFFLLRCRPLLIVFRGFSYFCAKKHTNENQVRDDRGERPGDPPHLRLRHGLQPREGVLQAQEGVSGGYAHDMRMQTLTEAEIEEQTKCKYQRRARGGRAGGSCANPCMRTVFMVSGSRRWRH